jgi:exopolysaccharide biosynthesis polyprenyl glycosylphosphotransferase
MQTTQPGAIDAVRGVATGLKTRPRPARFGTTWALVLFCADIASLAVAAVAAQAVVHGRFETLAGAPGALQPALFAALLWLMLFERIGMYRRSFSTTARDEVYASLAASAMAMLPALLIFVLFPALHPFRHLLVVALLFTAAGVGVSRFAVAIVRTKFLPLKSRRIAVVGSPERVASVPNDLSLTTADTVIRLPVDDFEFEVADAFADGGGIAELEWLRVALEREVDEVIVTESFPTEVMPALLRYLEGRGVKLAFAPIRIRPHACDFTVRRDGGLALFYPRSLAICTPGAEAARRAFDLAIAVPALALLSPLLVAIALAVRLDSRGPIFYTQRRVGRHGAIFKIVKFRTMRPDAEAESGPVWASTSGQARTTRIGKLLRRLSLDELPQLFNVVRGDMSIVGPRPERPFYVEQFRKMLPRYEERHLVRPGITGWSHVNMARDVDTTAIGERLSYDIFYLEHWSIFMDIVIICKTGAEFLFHAAA